MSVYVKTNNGVSNISESAIQFVKNENYYQVYDICHKLIRVVSGSIFVRATGQNYALLYSQAQLCKMFDTTRVDTCRLSITTYNGDGDSNPMNFYSIVVFNDDLYQYFQREFSGEVRINYRFVYVYPSK